MRVIVCGGRDWTDADFVYSQLDRLKKKWPPDVVIIEGDSRGVDRMAGYWARRNGLTNEKYPAKWKEHGKRAGPMRNQIMLDTGCDLVVAFPGGRGTENMKRRAQALNITLVEIFPWA